METCAGGSFCPLMYLAWRLCGRTSGLRGVDNHYVISREGSDIYRLTLRLFLLFSEHNAGGPLCVMHGRSCGPYPNRHNACLSQSSSFVPQARRQTTPSQVFWMIGKEYKMKNSS